MLRRVLLLCVVCLTPAFASGRIALELAFRIHCHMCARLYVSTHMTVNSKNLTSFAVISTTCGHYVSAPLHRSRERPRHYTSDGGGERGAARLRIFGAATTTRRRMRVITSANRIFEATPTQSTLVLHLSGVPVCSNCTEPQQVPSGIGCSQWQEQSSSSGCTTTHCLAFAKTPSSAAAKQD
jgi:hypothetical protein